MRAPTVLSVGIDVSKDTLVTCIRSRNAEESVIFPNTGNGITALLRPLGRRRCPVVMESTGRYHILAALLLTKKGHDVHVVNPIMARR